MMKRIRRLLHRREARALRALVIHAGKPWLDHGYSATGRRDLILLFLRAERLGIVTIESRSEVNVIVRLSK